MIETKLGYKFKNKNLLKQALTHSSYANEYMIESNERLEFLGDAILGCVVARILYNYFQDKDEGELSKMRSALVSRSNFASYAKKLKIEKQILLGKGEENTGGRNRESNLAGTFEAVMGAIYLDSGYRKSYSIISKLIKESLKNWNLYSDYKTELQELVQKKFKRIPKYSITKEEGPPHEKIYHVRVKISKDIVGNGVGKNKKEAEQEAAKLALEYIREID